MPKQVCHALTGVLVETSKRDSCVTGAGVTPSRAC